MNNKKIIQIQDENGKAFDVDISKICDINGDMGENSPNITDSQNNRVSQVHDVVYVNQKGEAIDNMQLLQDMASGKTQVVAVDVEIEATHSGKNHNYCVYYEDSMEKDYVSFLNPFRKPMLKNHDSHSEPLGRITDSWYAPSKLTDERSTINLKVRVTDQDAIPKFLDGRYGTVSIGGTMGTVTCNICGKTILKDGKFKFCGHWRGESYKDQVCYWGARDIEYHEVSTVNNPADDFAQVMKVTVITDSDKQQNSKEEKTMGDNKDNNQTTVLKQIGDLIDSLLNNSPSDPVPAPVADQTGTTSTPSPEQTDTSNAQGSTQTQDNTSELEQVKKELNDAKEKITSLEQELTTAKDNLTKAQQNLTVAEAETSQLRDKCVTLATANKQIIVDSIISKEISANKLKAENKDSRSEELMGKSMKDLNQLIKDLETTEDATATQRNPVTVPNPTLANPDNTTDSNGNTDTNNNNTGKQATTKTVEDFANDIISKILK